MATMQTEAGESLLSYDGVPSPRARTVLKRNGLPWKGTLYAVTIETDYEHQGKGHGDRLMGEFLGMADRKGMAVILDAVPIGLPPNETYEERQREYDGRQTRLVAWYGRLGFVLLQKDANGDTNKTWMYRPASARQGPARNPRRN